jgi:hypothetical protein
MLHADRDGPYASRILPGGGSGFWHGMTTLSATLAEIDGRAVYQFRAHDHDEEWNAFGGGSGTTAAQKSLRDALRRLVRQMAARDLPTRR